jgi:hypothetical protein
VFEDAKKQCKQAWYDNYINNTHFMKCFRDKRDFNTHEKNIPITRDVSLSISIIGTKVVVDKKEEKYFPPNEESKKVKLEKKVGKFEFTDYSGKEDILTLSTKYLKELKAFVVEAQDNNII